MSRLPIAAALGLGAALACQPPTPAGLAEADQTAIRAAADSAVALAGRAPFDAQAYASVIYTPDAILLPPNEPPVSGRDAIAAWLAAFPPFTDFRVEQVMVEGQGDLAYVHGRYSMMVTHPGATEPTHDAGKYIEIWRKGEDGTWQVTHDIFNSDHSAPVPAPAPAASPAKR